MCTKLNQLVVRFSTLVFLVAPGDVGAQLVRGQVMDSVTGVPVPEAFVSLAGPGGNEAASTYADTRGWFLLRAPDPGPYRLVAMSEGYRRSAFPMFQLQSDQMRSYVLLLPTDRVDLGLPAARTEALVSRHCGDVDEGSRVIVGTVRDASSGNPVAGAEVLYSIPDVTASDSIEMSGDRSFSRSMSEADGTYAICHLPAMSRISLHVTADSRASTFEAVLFGTGGVFADEAFHPLTLPVWRQDLELLSADLRTASIVGSVTDTAGGPLGSALVEIAGSEYRTMTGADGRFRLSGLTQGNIRLRVRKVGYSPVEYDADLVPGTELDLSDDALALAQFPLRLRDIIASGDPLRANPRLDGFFQRRENSPRGKFVTETEWQTRLHFNVTDVTSRLRYGLERSSICDEPTSYFLDGVYIYLPTGVSINDFVDPSYLAAVEAYGHGFDAPIRYRRRGCGSVILLWSK